MFKTYFYLGQLPWHGAFVALLVAFSFQTSGSFQILLLTTALAALAVRVLFSTLKERLGVSIANIRWEVQQTSPYHHLRYACLAFIYLLGISALVFSAFNLNYVVEALIFGNMAIGLTQLILLFVSSYILFDPERKRLFNLRRLEGASRLLSAAELGNRVQEARVVQSLGDGAAALVHGYVFPDTFWQGVATFRPSTLAPQHYRHALTGKNVILLENQQAFERMPNKNFWVRVKHPDVHAQTFRRLFEESPARLQIS